MTTLHSIVVEAFHLRPKILTLRWNIYKSIRVSRLHLLENMHVLEDFMVIRVIVVDISVWTKGREPTGRRYCL